MGGSIVAKAGTLKRPLDANVLLDGVKNGCLHSPEEKPWSVCVNKILLGEGKKEQNAYFRKLFLRTSWRWSEL